MSITSEQLRDALRHFPAGVTIVTIKVPDADTVHGLTVSSFTSISLEPPLIMIAIDHRSWAQQLLGKDGATFAVSILPQDKMELSNRFAWLKDTDRFSEGNWTTALTGAPVLEDALAWLDCTVYASHDAGTHTIYIGQVEASGVPQPDQPPLVYWNRGYRQLKVSDKREV
jgi:flavin reductase (DIM6/NTAB) family NADH-FMN oxidoreductase RutF